MEAENCGMFKNKNLPEQSPEGFLRVEYYRRIVSTGVYFMLNASATPL